MKPGIEADLVRDPLFPRLQAFLIEATGMVFYADKDDDLARVVATRCKARAVIRCASYLDLLTDPVGGQDELDAVIAEMTIGETYFFRHREQFEALRDIIFPAILERNREIRRLRIWSAGCATGPEPYSIAILLRRHFAAATDGWNISILGTDINQKFLARARDGIYDDWAFRAVPEDIKRQCFVKDGKHWIINKEYRDVVTFQYHNMISNVFPSILNNISAFDLIVCRNVIIYFSQETVRSLVPRFYDSLVAHGWLIMGHAESNLELFREFRTINAPGAVIYQKVPTDDRDKAGDGARPAPPSVPPPSLSPPPPPPPRPVVARPPVTPRPPPSLPAAPCVAAGDTPHMAELKQLGDRGAWEQAETLCCQLLEADPLDAMLHYYHGLMLEQMGRPADSEQALRRAIYLDRTFILPHYHMGLLGVRLGDRAKAGRFFHNALRLLDRIDAAKLLTEADGLTAAQLKEMVESQLDILGAR